MTDNLSKKQRSYCMSQIKRANTRPEIIFKNRLKGFQHNPVQVYGNPDFINWISKTVIFVDGCFWHMCPRHFKEPKTNKDYWLPKLLRNITRDKEITLAYKNAGWKVIRIWEHNLKF